MEENKKIFQGAIIEVGDYSKIARLRGENKKPEQVKLMKPLKNMQIPGQLQE